MPQVQQDVETFARIKVLGVGGSGGNAIEHMITSKVKGVDFVAVNTDSQDLHHSSAKKKIHIGKNLTKGLGAGGQSDMGKRSAEETQEELHESLKGADMTFITCGLGGGTGNGAAPKVAEISKESGALTVAVCTKPFSFEGKQRMKIAEQALADLKTAVDAIIVIPNDRLLQTIDKQTTIKNTFAMSDEVLKQAVEGISDLITNQGYINVDFADIRSILQDAGSALMGIGSSSGEKRAEEAAKMAINSPLLELSISGAKGVLFSIAGGEDLTAFEMQEAANIITENVDENARIIFGLTNDPRLKKNEVRVTVIAAGFPEEETDKILFTANSSLGNANGAMGARAAANLTSSTNRNESTSEPKKADFGTLSRTNNANSRTQAKPADTTKKLDATTDDDGEKEEVEERGSIFNSMPFMRRSDSTETTAADTAKNKKAAASIEEISDDDDDDDDDWGSVPSFLRRSKLK